ncbi:MAG: hypothetical protein K0Q76_187 [Panacagrimonas sp.]|jgi:hypothetical protein|nr:hypothetical protein [Panacagrimonas sp.]MCC2655079.1 hypothetical protein [Panacagrimonas sp.]
MKPRDPATTPIEYTTVTGSAEFADAALQVIGAARHQLALLSVDLERKLFGTDEFTQRLRAFILAHRRANLRVLVHDPVAAVRNSIRLVEFGRLLSSRIEFRTMPEERRKRREEYLIADERALLYRSSPDQLEAKHYLDAPMVARSHLREFDAVWNEATVAREMSSLRL